MTGTVGFILTIIGGGIIGWVTPKDRRKMIWAMGAVLLIMVGAWMQWGLGG